MDAVRKGWPHAHRIGARRWRHPKSPSESLNGKEGPIGLMPPIGVVLSDEQIAAVLTYIRREWGQRGERGRAIDGQGRARAHRGPHPPVDARRTDEARGGRVVRSSRLKRVLRHGAHEESEVHEGAGVGRPDRPENQRDDRAARPRPSSCASFPSCPPCRKTRPRSSEMETP